MKKNIIIFIITVLILINFVDASVVGVSPSIVRFNKMIKEGYAEVNVVASTSFVQPLRAHFSKEGEIADWMRFEPDVENFVFSINAPYSFTLIMEPPADATNGNYTGTIKITTDELASVETGAGSSIIAQVAMLIFVEIVDDQIIACRAGAISSLNAEFGDNFGIRATVHNDGNVRLRPEIEVRVYDQLQTQLMFSRSYFGDQILPTRNKDLYNEITNDLEIGQYFAEIFFKDCGITKKTTFDILEKGQISDAGTLIGIRTYDVVNVNEPVYIGPMFRNLGERTVIAQFKGEIRNLRNNKIVQLIESDALEVTPGKVIEFRMFFTPTKASEYQISGRVKYNNKLTFDEKSKIITAKGEFFDFSLIIYFILYIIFGLIILILIGKIKRARKKRRHKKLKF